MDWPDVASRIEAGEDERAEFKLNFRDRSAIGRAICAFANTDGGVVVLGVDNARTVVGVPEDAEQLQERLSAYLQTGCSSPVNARLGRHRAANGWVHWISITRQRGFEPMRCDGRVWVRRGRSTVEPSPAELQDLFNTFGYVLTEEQVIGSASAADIDPHAFRDYLDAVGIDTDTDPQPRTDDDLRNRGVLAEREGRLQPTLYGLLAFGKDPQRFPQTAGLLVDCVAYDGMTQGAPVLQAARAAGRLDEQVDRALGWFKALGRFESYDDIRRHDRYLLPLDVVREAVVNAVTHRDYAITGSQVLMEVFEDRVVVTSPGSLPNSITPESVQAGGRPRSRNESIANYLLSLRYIEKRGRGWPRMRIGMRDFNGTEPEMLHDAISRWVQVTLRLGGVG